MTDLAQLGIEIKSQGVRQGIAELDTLTGAAKRVEPAVRSAAQATTDAAAKIGVGARATDQLTQALNEDERAVASWVTAMRGAGASAQAQIDILARLAGAQRAAAAGWKEMGSAGAANLANIAASRQIASMGQGFAVAGAGARTAAREARVATQEITQIGYQISDIGVQLAGGMGAGRTFSQQLPQLLAGRTGLADIKALGAGIGQFLTNPVTLAIAGVSALGFAFDHYMSSASTNVNDVDAVLEKHSATVKMIKDAWGEAGRAVREYAPPSYLRAGAEQLADTRRLTAAALAQGRKTLDGLFSEADPFANTSPVDTYAFPQITGAIDAFRRSVQAGRPDFKTLLDTVDDLYSADTTESPKLKKLRESVHALADEGERLQAALRNFTLDDYLSGLQAKPNEFLEYKFQIDKAAQQATENYGFGMRETRAYSAQDRAALAADRARAGAQWTGEDADLAARRAYDLSYAQSARQNADADRAWTLSMQQRFQAQELGIKAIGATAAATAEAQFKLEEYARIQEQALTRGTAWAEQQRAAIDTLAPAWGRLAEQSAGARLMASADQPRERCFRRKDARAVRPLRIEGALS